MLCKSGFEKFFLSTEAGLKALLLSTGDKLIWDCDDILSTFLNGEADIFFLSQGVNFYLEV